MPKEQDEFKKNRKKKSACGRKQEVEWARLLESKRAYAQPKTENATVWPLSCKKAVAVLVLLFLANI
jgi:hypothetical protein